MGRLGSLKAVSREVENGLHLLAGKAIEHLHNLVNCESIFKVLEDGGGGYARAAEDPGSAHLAGNALHRFALGPVEGHEFAEPFYRRWWGSAACPERLKPRGLEGRLSQR